MNFPVLFSHAQVKKLCIALVFYYSWPIVCSLWLLIIVGFPGAFLIVISYVDGVVSYGRDRKFVNEYWHISWNFHAGIAIVIRSLVLRVLLGTSVLLIDTSSNLLTLCLQFIVGFKSLFLKRFLVLCKTASYQSSQMRAPSRYLVNFFISRPLLLFFFPFSSLACLFVWVPLATSFTGKKHSAFYSVTVIESEAESTFQAFKFLVSLFLLLSWTFSSVYQGGLQISNLFFPMLVLQPYVEFGSGTVNCFNRISASGLDEESIPIYICIIAYYGLQSAEKSLPVIIHCVLIMLLRHSL